MLLVLCLALVFQTGMVSADAASGKNGLVTSNGKTYYYSNGKKVVNAFKTVKGSKYYFGKNGAAVTAPVPDPDDFPDVTMNVVCKKIGKVKRCFDQQGHMMKKGIYADLDGNAYYVKNWKVVEAKTKKIQSALGYLADSKSIRSLLGKPAKTDTSTSCLFDGGTDLTLTYDFVKLYLYQNNAGKEQVLYLEPR